MQVISVQGPWLTGHLLNQLVQSEVWLFNLNPLPNCSFSWFQIPTFPSISFLSVLKLLCLPLGSLIIYCSTAHLELLTAFKEVTSPQIPAVVFKKSASCLTTPSIFLPLTCCHISKVTAICKLLKDFLHLLFISLVSVLLFSPRFYIGSLWVCSP